MSTSTRTVVLVWIILSRNGELDETGSWSNGELGKGATGNQGAGEAHIFLMVKSYRHGAYMYT